MKSSALGMALVWFVTIATALFLGLSLNRSTKNTSNTLLSMSNHLDAITTEMNNKDTQVRSLIGTIQSCYQILIGLQKKLEAAVDRPDTQPQDQMMAMEEGIAETPVSLPTEQEPPTTMRPQVLFRKTLKDIIDDTSLNPTQQQPGGDIKAELQLELTKIQAQLSVFAAEINLELIKNMNVLRESGEYIEYKEGDIPPRRQSPEILSVAEGLPGGLRRMYFIEPERFPFVHDKRKEREASTAQTIKALYRIMNKE